MKKIFLFFVSILLLFSFYSCNKIPTEYEKIDDEKEIFIPTLRIGDYLSIGKYKNEDIIWRCVDIDENGILMLSDKIISLKPFDGAGINNSGSHVRANGKVRQKNGSDFWEDSNIRSWLNSSEEAGHVTWLCGNQPNSESTSDGFNAYENEAGFLSNENFTLSEKKAILEVKQNCLLNGFEYTFPNADERTFNFVSLICNLDNTDTDVFGEELSDKFFLLDVFQLYKVFKNSNILGDDYYIGKPTVNAFNTSDYKDIDLNPQKIWYTALKTPNTNSQDSCQILCVFDKNGKIEKLNANTSYIGIRPAFYLDSKNALCVSGDGSIDKPYLIK